MEGLRMNPVPLVGIVWNQDAWKWMVFSPDLDEPIEFDNLHSAYEFAKTVEGWA